jgi:hypothetical protein
MLLECLPAGPLVPGAVLNAVWIDGKRGSKLRRAGYSMRRIARWFASVSPETLMRPKDRAALAALPEVVTVFRGAPAGPLRKMAACPGSARGAVASADPACAYLRGAQDRKRGARKGRASSDRGKSLAQNGRQRSRRRSPARSQCCSRTFGPGEHLVGHLAALDLRARRRHRPRHRRPAQGDPCRRKGSRSP